MLLAATLLLLLLGLLGLWGRCSSVGDRAGFGFLGGLALRRGFGGEFGDASAV